MPEREISQNYASPNVRVGLLKEDWPGVEITYALVDAADLPASVAVPAEFAAGSIYLGAGKGSKQASGKFCLCTIKYPADAGKDDEHGAKPVLQEELDRGDPETWNSMCTKALGRALKRAGYPDAVPDLRSLILWRQRTAEIDRIRQGLAPIAELTSGNTQRALDAAFEAGAQDDPDVDRSATTDHEDEPPAGQQQQRPPAQQQREAPPTGGNADKEPTAEQLTELRVAIGALGNKQTVLRAWAAEQKIVSYSKPGTVGQLVAIMHKIAQLNTAGPDGTPQAPDPKAEQRAQVEVEKPDDPIEAHQLDDIMHVIDTYESDDYDAFEQWAVDQGFGERPIAVTQFTQGQAEATLRWMEAYKRPVPAS